jgi:hypothetical protein
MIIERRQKLRQQGSKIIHDFALQSWDRWEPEPDIKKIEIDFWWKLAAALEIAIFSVCLAGFFFR